jgi:ribonuclease G
MAKEICISSTPHETRLAILEDDQLTEIYYERENEYTLAGSIYKGRVTRVLPGMQSAFVDLGLERDAFLYVTDFMEEQEDGEEFEKIPTGNGGGSGGGNGGRREGQTPRIPRDSGRPPRAAISVEPEAENGAAIEISERAEGEVAGKDEESGDGTRRWRGRRGRRRGGRPHGSRESAGASPQEPRAAQPLPDLEIEVEAGPTVYEDTISPGSGQAVFSERVAPLAPPVRSHSVPQPIVLPGESLSRYGGKPAESAPRQQTSSPAAAASSYKPSTLVEVLPTWDGGAELPGESLSRHRTKSNGSQSSAPEAVEAPTASGHASQELAAAGAVEPFSETFAAPVPTFESQPVDFAQEHDPVAADPFFGEPATPEARDFVAALPAELAEPASEVEAHREPELHGEVEARHHSEAQHPEAAPEAHATGHEETSELSAPLVEEHSEHEAHFEPDHASASYRIDPVAPSEYRLSSVVEEEPETEVHHHEVVEEIAEIATPQPVHGLSEGESASSGVIEHTEVPEEIAAVSYEEAVAQHPDAAHEHAHSAAPSVEASFAETIEELAHPAELPHPAETVFQDEDEAEEEALGFAPGHGPLEEELIEEEEYDSEPIRAYLDDGELDDLEEETLDNLPGAELGEMVRDAHLEQRIHVATGGIAIDEEEADTDYAESELEEGEDEPEGAGYEASTSAPAPARRDGRPDDPRRAGRGPRRRGRPNGGGSGGSRRANSQLSDLPIISELLKQGQEILVQIAKEPIAKKGARITSHIALPGRFLVFMPTVNHVGVSRKISSDEERQRLKRILISEKGAASGGFIVRTAADGASEEDLRADIRFLINLWSDIKQRADDGKAPALIYHDLNLIERVLRDQVSANFSTIWVDNEAEYERILRFLQRFEPSLVRRVKLYTKETPLFEQFGIQDEISKALKSKVWLKSGGSIVINQTEALVAIDINTGKYVGKTARLEDTILKTNLDAIPEIVRQIRLRDLGGIIVIDFIDMDDRRNRHKVMAALEEELKHDRAPSKVLQFNDFGLVAITRKRVKQSLERTLSVQCEICAGTGMVKSPTTVCNEIYTELRKMQKHLERGDVLLRVHPEVVKTLKANNAKWLNELEELTSKTIIVKSDPALHPEQFDIH